MHSSKRNLYIGASATVLFGAIVFAFLLPYAPEPAPKLPIVIDPVHSPPPPPKPLPPVRPEDIQLQVWTAITPLAYKRARETFNTADPATKWDQKK